jgi:hypothetical protein
MHVRPIMRGKLDCLFTVFPQVVSFGLNSFKLIAIILEKLVLNVADLGLVVNSGLLRESVSRVETMVVLVFKMMIILVFLAMVV